MHEIIAIGSSSINGETKQTVNARALYKFLEIRKDFSSWIKDQIQRARLVENQDFIVIAENNDSQTGGRGKIEYYITLEAGQRIAMKSISEKGFEAGDYLAECKRKKERGMHEIITIGSSNINGETKQTVNARDIHKFLEIGREFPNWIKDQIQRARLVENQDFIVIAEKGNNPSGGRPVVEYYITLEAGKHIAMMSQSDKGFEVRDYFIECEKIARNPIALLNDPAAMRGLLLTYAEKAIALTEQVKALEPKADGYDRIATSNGSLCITDAAKTLQMYPKQLTTFLSKDLSWIYRRVGNSHWVAYQKILNQGFMEHKVTTVTKDDGTEKVVEQARITSKGLARLSILLKTKTQKEQMLAQATN